MTQPTDRETALIMFRSTLALHGTPSPEAARIAIMYAARMAVEAGIPVSEYRRLTVDEYANTVSDHEAREAKLRALGFDAVDPDTLGTLAHDPRSREIRAGLTTRDDDQENP